MDEQQRTERRLAAILAADVAGYSRLMSRDEEGTLQRLKSHLGELIEPAGLFPSTFPISFIVSSSQ